MTWATIIAALAVYGILCLFAGAAFAIGGMADERERR